MVVLVVVSVLPTDVFGDVERAADIVDELAVETLYGLIAGRLFREIHICANTSARHLFALVRGSVDADFDGYDASKRNEQLIQLRFSHFSVQISKKSSKCLEFFNFENHTR